MFIQHGMDLRELACARKYAMHASSYSHISDCHALLAWMRMHTLRCSRIIAYLCMCLRAGAALDWAEKETTPIQHLGGCPWGMASAAELQGFLLATLGGEAVMLAETPGLEGKGFET